MNISVITAAYISKRHSNTASDVFTSTFKASPEEATRMLSRYPSDIVLRIHASVLELLDSHTLNRPAEQALENYLDLLPSEE